MYSTHLITPNRFVWKNGSSQNPGECGSSPCFGVCTMFKRTKMIIPYIWMCWTQNRVIHLPLLTYELLMNEFHLTLCNFNSSIAGEARWRLTMRWDRTNNDDIVPEDIIYTQVHTYHVLSYHISYDIMYSNI